MTEKPNIDLRRFEPKKIPAKYWVRFLLYGLILVALFLWFKHKKAQNEEMRSKTEQQELNLKGFEIEE